jgi:hypothetical protein
MTARQPCKPDRPSLGTLLVNPRAEDIEAELWVFADVQSISSVPRHRAVVQSSSNSQASRHPPVDSS